MPRFGRVIRNNDGATIIEFAIVAPVLFMLVFGIIEFSLLMFASSVVEGATNNAARLSKTGAERAVTGSAAQRAAADAARLRQLILDRGAGVLKDENLVITTVREDNTNSPMGNSGEVVIYSITYHWNVLTPLVGPLVADDGIYEIVATTAVVNEPYDDDVSNNQF